MEIWLIRHGQTADNHLKILAGHQPGKLSDLGIAQAIKTGKRLAKENFAEIYCSDLGRAKETLDNILLSFPNKDKLNIIYSDLLREKGAGALEGKSLGVWKENADKTGLSIRKYKAENGESWEDVYIRGEKFVDMLIDKYFGRKSEENKNELHKKEDVDHSIKKKELSIFEESKIDIGINGNSMSLTKKIAQSNMSSKISNDKGLPKILVVTHGGYIMEFFNVINSRKSNQKPIFLNNTKNCSINMLQITGKITKNTLGKETKDITYKIVLRNEDSHLSIK